ncbi:hypothetical protein ACHAXR_008889 [Thalassiosira sp. AJA248-18]
MVQGMDGKGFLISFGAHRLVQEGSYGWDPSLGAVSRSGFGRGRNAPPKCAMCLFVSGCCGCGMRNGGRVSRKKWMFGSCYILKLVRLTLCLNHFWWVFLSQCLTGRQLGDHGWSDKTENRWWKLDVPCQACQKHATYKSGIICANYGKTRGFSHPCQGAWCADCFTPHELDRFETAVPRDFNGASLQELEDEIRFKKARPGDHLCTPFQCPCCQSNNIRGRGLQGGEMQDVAFKCICIRATLDAFWAHSSRTVAAHVSEVKFIIKYSENLDIARPFP